MQTASNRDPKPAPERKFAEGNARMLANLPVEAAACYREAAEAGLAAAQLYLAVCFATGLGVPRDEDAAIEWFRTAARAGNRTAREELASRGVPE